MSYENKIFSQMESNEEAPQEDEEENTKHQIIERIDVELADSLENRSVEDLIEFEKDYNLLPADLKDFWKRKWIKESSEFEKMISDLEKINEHRKKENFEKVTGYHVSNKDLKEGSYLVPDSDGEIYYAEDIQKLYGKHAKGWLYAVEGTKDDRVVDEDLEWRATKGKMRIVGKYPMDDKNKDELGWDLADCEYK